MVTAQDLQRLPIAPGTVSVQPDRGWVLVNIDTIVFTDAAPQVLDTVVLGTPVRVGVSPVDYTWDFGDASAPVTTTVPGAPYPNHTVAHTYTRAAEGVSVGLTVRWSGQFEVNGSGVWQPVQGTAVTSAVSAPFDVRTVTVSLTNGSLPDH
ncbi:hypothetical protein MF406_06930 [Georgenia sp. TF02-10]|uniref:hypothetical protein n=1 Tax=Georgenia sp. TF02-10 TaxID=2917725 RepID=UPI001FA7A49D|nr:hypothetical protein [Georgenia sp. TF02-10]UNX55951.1 hypothetical protein MF406_06930 [Georgenia sp. TF02-10]